MKVHVFLQHTSSNQKPSLLTNLQRGQRATELMDFMTKKKFFGNEFSLRHQKIIIFQISNSSCRYKPYFKYITNNQTSSNPVCTQNICFMTALQTILLFSDLLSLASNKNYLILFSNHTIGFPHILEHQGQIIFRVF